MDNQDPLNSILKTHPTPRSLNKIIQALIAVLVVFMRAPQMEWSPSGSISAIKRKQDTMRTVLFDLEFPLGQVVLFLAIILSMKASPQTHLHRAMAIGIL